LRTIDSVSVLRYILSIENKLSWSRKMLDPEMEKIIETIRKLQAKADDASATEAEAALFSSKVLELMGKYNLSYKHLEQSINVVEIDELAWNILYPHPWIFAIAHAAARLYMCKIYKSQYWDAAKGRYRPNVVFVGQGHNTLVAKQMTEYLVSTTFRAGSEYMKQIRVKKGMPRYSVAKHGYEKGFGLGLYQRLCDMRAEQLKNPEERDPMGNPRNLPALYNDQDVLIDGFLQNKGLITKKTRDIFLNGDARQGRLDSEKVSLNRQIEGDKRDFLPVPAHALPAPGTSSP
jgi:hypothetical protein